MVASTDSQGHQLDRYITGNLQSSANVVPAITSIMGWLHAIIINIDSNSKHTRLYSNGTTIVKPLQVLQPP